MVVSTFPVCLETLFVEYSASLETNIEAAVQSYILGLMVLYNPLGFLYWLAGGGVKGGHSHGETDPLGHEAVVDRHHIRDLHATILHLMGLDHEKLTYFYGGLNHKLTGVQRAEVIHDVIA